MSHPSPVLLKALLVGLFACPPAVVSSLEQPWMERLEEVAAFDQISQNWHLSNKLEDPVLNTMAVETLKEAAERGALGDVARRPSRNRDPCPSSTGPGLPSHLPSLGLLLLMLDTGYAPGKRLAFVKR